MKNEKDNIDKLIREALSEEEMTFLKDLEEKDLLGQLGAVYKGKLGWLTALMTVVQVLLFLVAIGFVVLFLKAETTQDMITWGAAGFLCLMSVTMLKLFIWMQINKNDVLREIKKLELLFVSYLERTKH